MGDDDGWFRIHRKFFRSPDIQRLSDAERWVAMYLMGLARWEPTEMGCRKHQRVVVPAGGLVCRYTVLARELGKTYRTVRRTVDLLLESQTLVEVGQLYSTKGSPSPVVRFANWDQYQPQMGDNDRLLPEQPIPPHRLLPEQPIGPDRLPYRLLPEQTREERDLHAHKTTFHEQRDVSPTRNARRQQASARVYSCKQLSMDQWGVLNELRATLLTIDRQHSLAESQAWRRAVHSWARSLLTALGERRTTVERLREAIELLPYALRYRESTHSMADLVRNVDRIPGNARAAKAAQALEARRADDERKRNGGSNSEWAEQMRAELEQRERAGQC